MAPTKTRNPVYEHFSAIEGDDKRMQCNYCSATITKLSSNLETHLKTQHKSIFSEHGKGKEGLVRKRKAGETSQSAAKQQKIAPFFGKSLIMSHCVGLVVNNGRPFSIFKDKDLVALIQLAKGKVGETIEIYPEAVKDAVRVEAENKRKEICALLAGKVLSLSLDMATCRQRSFFGLNAQLYLDGAVRVICLQCREVVEQHFSRNIQQWITDGQKEFKIMDTQIVALSIDSANNMKRAVDDFITNLTEDEEPGDDYGRDDEQSPFDPDPIKEIDFDEALSAPEDTEEEREMPFEKHDTAVRMLCVAHQLQLAINAFLWKDPGNTKLIVVAQKLAAKLRNQSVRIMIDDAKLKQAILDQKTRWNSTYLMINRLLELKEFCEAKAALLKGLTIPVNMWKRLQEMAVVLEPVAKLTTQLQSEQLDVTQFVYCWEKAMFALDRQGRQGNADKLRLLIRDRESKIFDNQAITAAIYLDKRFSFTLTPEKVTEAKAFIYQVSKKRKILAGIAEDPVEEPILIDNESNPSDEFAAHFARLAQNTASQQVQAHKKPEALQLELDDYDKLPRLELDAQIMEFWKAQEQLPLMKEIATDIISIPVTEVTVERMFSHLTFILNRYRSALKADLLEDIMFLRLNKKFQH